MKKIENFTPKKILVLQQRQLGDVVVATPVFSVLKKAFPNAYLALFTEEKCLPLIEHDPHLDGFEVVVKNSFFKSLSLYFNIWKKKYDLVVDLQQLPRCQLATLFSRAKYRLSFTPRHKYRNFLYTHFSLPENFTDYTSFGKIKILTQIGLEAVEERPKLYLSENERDEAIKILQDIGITENQHFITLDATHKHVYRRWKYYFEFVQKLLMEYPDLKVLILRAPGEEEQVKHILEIDSLRICMPEKPLTLRQSMACMSHAKYHVGNTSAPAHMALALNIPALIILSRTGNLWYYDPKNPDKFSAKQKEVRVDKNKLQSYQEDELKAKKLNIPFQYIDNPDINLISPDQAIEAFKELVKNPYY